jgi:hypothetical protein
MIPVLFIRYIFFILSLLFIIFIQPLYADQTGIIQTDEVIVIFDEPLRIAAKEVADIYSGLKAELEKTFNWEVNFKPTVRLIRNRNLFQRMDGGDLIVAFAIPQKNWIVIDYSKMGTHPFTLGTTLKHEMCHLLLHHRVRGANLPKWLDEGISQWVSGGIGEMMIYNKRSILRKAVLAGNYIKINELTERFPQDKKSLMLAYEESKSLVEYIINKFGKNKLLNILKYLEEGYEADVAIRRALSIPLDELERRWHKNLRKRSTWLIYVSTNIYEILFFLGALITVYGFIRFMIKKKNYGDEEDDIMNEKLL